MNFLPSEIKNKFVLLTMSLKLTIKVVAFFLGHPVLDFFNHKNMPSAQIAEIRYDIVPAGWDYQAGLEHI